jgi:hypothetical protein
MSKANPANLAPGGVCLDAAQESQSHDLFGQPVSIRQVAAHLNVRPAVVRHLLHFPALLCDAPALVATTLNGIAPDHWPRALAVSAWQDTWTALRTAGADDTTAALGVRLIGRQSRGRYELPVMAGHAAAARVVLPLRRLLTMQDSSTTPDPSSPLPVATWAERLSVRGVFERHEHVCRRRREIFDQLLKETSRRVDVTTVPEIFPARLGPLELIPLRSATDLGRAARGLHNCLGSYRYELVSGQDLLLGVRQAGQWQAAIHLALFDQPPYALAFEARGPHNQEVEAPVTRLAHALAASIDASAVQALSTAARAAAKRLDVDRLAAVARAEALRAV